MEARIASQLQWPKWVGSDNFARTPAGSLAFSRSLREPQKAKLLISAQLRPHRTMDRHRSISLEVSCSYNNFAASILESGSVHAPFDEAFILKNKSQEIESYLNGRCIYLVGMMGSGKTTVGKILSQVLGYSFCDSDNLVEHELNGTSVAEIFKLYGEGFFRTKETEALQRLSAMHRIVVSTGGGAVIRPINWRYMQEGISVWLDVPLEALAQRITAVGTSSRPLLHHESGDAYKKTFKRLSSLLEERGEAYANADAKVSLENIANKKGHGDVLNVTPTAIAIETLEQIEGYLQAEGDMDIAGL